MNPDEVHVAILPGRVPLNKPGNRDGSFMQSTVELWKGVVLRAFASDGRTLDGGIPIPGFGVATLDTGLESPRAGAAIQGFRLATSDDAVASPRPGVAILKGRVAGPKAGVARPGRRVAIPKAGAGHPGSSET